MPESAFYLGRLFDLNTSRLTSQPFFYDPADLTTHAIVTGMTGSGKTGLCIALLEEAALQGIPALIVDPKGDLTNLLLHFPNLSPQDFQPWIDPLLARRSGKTPEEAAAEAASLWRQGLSEWNLPPERLRALAESVEFAIYTPGSNAGLPLSMIRSLSRPVEGETGEALSERISSLVTALLALIGIQADPIRSREYVLLANIFENAWREGREIDIAELVLQTQSPPFEKLGAFPVDTFFPPKERAELAIALNSILASPAFQTWREGQPLEIASLLFTPEGRPRHSIFYLAHLSENERMFFLTLLLSTIESWMCSQPGTSSLRALFYMDEIFGYLPPLGNPPSKKPLLRLLKQARAFGLGLLLATQNPADIDYKGLSNAGTWFIGKLQTEQDKERLLDGLQSINSNLSRAELNKLISSLGKRVFLAQNIHQPQPLVFQTRWTMNFLAGPIAPAQIAALNTLAGASLGPSRSRSAIQQDLEPAAVPRGFVHPEAFPPAAPTAIESSQTRPSLPAEVGEYFFPLLSLPQAFQAATRPMSPSAEIEAILYRPALLAVAQVRFLNHKYGVDSEVLRAVLLPGLERRLTPRWEDFPYQGPALEKLESVPAPSARFALLPAPFSDPRFLATLRRDFVEWVYGTTTVKAKANPALKVYAGPDISQAEFIKACAEAARQARDAEVARQLAALERRIKAVQEKLAREERELRRDEAEYQQRKIEELGTHAENILGLFSRRSMRRLSTSLTRRRLTEQAKAEVEESLDAIKQYKEELAALEQERAKQIEEIHARWAAVVNQVEEITLTPRKSDITLPFFGIVWRPFYIVNTPEGRLELAAFEQH